VISAGTNLADNVYSADNKALVFSNYSDKDFKPSDQAAMQLAAVGITLCLAIIPGLLVGWLLKCDCLLTSPSEFFTDDIYWTMEEEESAEDDTKEKETKKQVIEMKVIEGKKSEDKDNEKKLTKRASKRDDEDV